jgi:hypothetical protein
VPAGTLRRATAYPGAADDWTPDQIREALGKVGLTHLKDKIEDEETPWDQTRIVPSLRIFTAAKSCWQDARAVQNSSAISTSCPARAKGGCLEDGCVGPSNLATRPRRGNIQPFQKGRPACYDVS